MKKLKLVLVTLFLASSLLSQTEKITINWEYNPISDHISEEKVLFRVWQIINDQNYLIAKNIPSDQRSFQYTYESGDSLAFMLQTFSYVEKEEYASSVFSDTVFFPERQGKIQGDSVAPAPPVVVDYDTTTVDSAEMRVAVLIKYTNPDWQQFELAVETDEEINSFHFILKEGVFDWLYCNGVAYFGGAGEENNDGIVSSDFYTEGDVVKIVGDIEKDIGQYEHIDLTGSKIIINGHSATIREIGNPEYEYGCIVRW